MIGVLMEYDHDVIIVGAGPAGLNAGYYSALSGADVLIVDKKTELGKPVRCAEAIIESVLHDNELEPKKEFISNPVNSFRAR